MQNVIILRYLIKLPIKLGKKESNLCITESKSVALPLGYIPIRGRRDSNPRPLARQANTLTN
jgi:hypothetical protein